MTIFFNADGSTGTGNRRIVSYEWNFGDGSTGTGITTTKSYSRDGTYVVALTVTDDAGQKGTVTAPVTVGTPLNAPTPVLTVSPTTGFTSTIFTFDGSATRGPSAIVEYRFSWGDTTPDTVGSSPTTTHRFTLAGVYVVRLTVRDSVGRIGTTTATVTVSVPTS
jgi:PKD repeat protein